MPGSLLQLRLQHAVRDLPTLQRVEFDGDGVSKSRVLSRSEIRVARAGTPAPGGAGTARPDRARGSRRGRAQAGAPRRRRRSGAASAPPGRRPGASASKLHGSPATRAPGTKFRGSKGWSGCDTTTASAGAPFAGAHGVIDHVEQLAHGYGRRTRQVGALVAARVGDHRWSRAASRASRRVGDPRCARHGRRRAGSRAVRSSPSRSMWRGKLPSSSPSRHTTRCGTERIGTSVQTVRWPGAEVGPRRPALQAVGHHRPHIVTAEPTGLTSSPVVASRPARRGAAASWARCQLSRVVVARHRVGDARQVSAQRRSVPSGEVIERRSQAVHELGEAPGQLDVAAVDVVEGEDPAEEPLALLGHGHAQQYAVEPRLPGVRSDAGRAGTARGARRRSPSARPAPLTHSSTRNRSSSLKPEPAADRLAARQVEHLGRRDPAPWRDRAPRPDADDRIGLPERAVGQPDPRFRWGRRPGRCSRGRPKVA